MIYDVNGQRIKKYPSLVGDGVTDDTIALQGLVNSEKVIRIVEGLKIKITSPISIDVSKIKLFDGGNSQFIVDGDFTAFELTGSITTGMSASPSTLTEDIIQNESMFIFQNCKIRSTSKTDGVGLSISGCFQTIVRNNHFCELDTGIEVTDRNRNISINENHIYKINSYGIHFMEGLNLHQVNTHNNFISYCKYCIFVDNVENLINWSCVGNSMEIHDYDQSLQDTGRCIKVLETDSGSESSAIAALTEVVITGNNIQAHTDAQITIEMVGSEHKVLNHFNISGNHIGNGAKYSIVLDNCKCVSVSGNSAVSGQGTYTHVSPDYWIKVKDSRDVVITGNAIRSTGGLAVSDGTINGLIIMSNVGENCAGRTIDMSDATVTGAIIKDNVFDGVVAS